MFSIFILVIFKFLVFSKFLLLTTPLYCFFENFDTNMFRYYLTSCLRDISNLNFEQWSPGSALFDVCLPFHSTIQRQNHFFSTIYHAKRLPFEKNNNLTTSRRNEAAKNYFNRKNETLLVF